MDAFFQLLGGLVVLIYSGDALVRGAVSMSRRLNVPPMIVGLTVVAFGTSAPELVVGIDAVWTGAPTLALGNVIGSNIANIWLVVGLPAIMSPFVCTAEKCTRNMFAMLLATGLFIALAFTGDFTYWNAGILLAGLFVFLIFSAMQKNGSKGDYSEILEEIEGLPQKPDKFRIALFWVFLGLLGLSFGAHYFVKGAVNLAIMFDVPETIIGLTLVAVGTSIPELVTSIAASMRKHCDVAIGNILGSNIFNLLGIIGVAAMFGPIPVPQGVKDFDLWVMLFAALTFLPFALLGKNVSRTGGIVFCLAYGLYIVFLAHGASGIDYHAVPFSEIMP